MMWGWGNKHCFFGGGWSVSLSFNPRIWTFGTEITASSNQSQAVVLGLPKVQFNGIMESELDLSAQYDQSYSVLDQKPTYFLLFGVDIPGILSCTRCRFRLIKFGLHLDNSEVGTKSSDWSSLALGLNWLGQSVRLPSLSCGIQLEWGPRDMIVIITDWVMRIEDSQRPQAMIIIIGALWPCWLKPDMTLTSWGQQDDSTFKTKEHLTL